MTPEETALAKMLAACKQWDWDAKIMLGLDAIRPDGMHMVLDGALLGDMTGWYPDLEHWGAVGCLLGMVVAEDPLIGLWSCGIVGDPRPQPMWCASRASSMATERQWDTAPGPALAKLLLEIWEAKA